MIVRPSLNQRFGRSARTSELKCSKASADCLLNPDDAGDHQQKITQATVLIRRQEILSATVTTDSVLRMISRVRDDMGSRCGFGAGFDVVVNFWK